MTSIIIPVLNEQKALNDFLPQLNQLNSSIEIIFVDGGSTDQTLELIKKKSFTILNSEKGRAKQMNHGARKAKGEFLLFLHADVSIPIDFDTILTELENNQTPLANFKLAFDFEHWFLRLNAIFSYSTATSFQFGDQGLWVQKSIFNRVGGFNETMQLIEDQDLVKRLKQYAKLKKIDAVVTVSARKYLKHGIFKLQFVYFYIYFLYSIGVKQNRLVKKLKKMLE